MPAFSARCRSRSDSWPVFRSCPIDRSGVPSSAYSVISHPDSGWLMSSVRPVNASVPTPFSDSEPSTTRDAPRPGRMKPAGANAGRIEDLHALAAIRRIGDGEAAVEGDVERARLDQPALFRADLHELAAPSPAASIAIDGVAAPIEHVVVAVGGLLEANRIAEEPTTCGARPPDGLRTSTRPGMALKGRRQKAKGRRRCRTQKRCLHCCILPSAFCLLPC